MKTCIAFADKCVNKAVPDVHEFLRGSMGILDICDRKSPLEIVSRIRIMNACDAKLNASGATFQVCNDPLSDSLNRQSNDYLSNTIFTTGTSLLQLCW